MVHTILTYSTDNAATFTHIYNPDNLNEKSKAAALRLGFTFEGIFRQHMIIKGLNRDSAYFSLLDSEWADSAKAALEAKITK